MLNTKHQSLDGFLKEIALDCWKGTLDEATITVECKKTGSFADGSTNYQLHALYQSKHFDQRAAKRIFTDTIAFDKDDMPDDYVSSVAQALRHYGIPTDRENSTLAIRMFALRQQNMSTGIITRILTAPRQPIAEASVIESYRRMHQGAEPHGTCMNCRDLIAIGHDLKLTDGEILAGISTYYSR